MERKRIPLPPITRPDISLDICPIQFNYVGDYKEIVTIWEKVKMAGSPIDSFPDIRSEDGPFILQIFIHKNDFSKFLEFLKQP